MRDYPYHMPHDEVRRPGLGDVIETVRAENPCSNAETVRHIAKQRWHLAQRDKQAETKEAR